MHHIGFNLAPIEVGKVEERIELKEIHLQQASLVHKGVIATVADVVAGFAAYLLLGLGDKVVTNEFEISYLRSAKATTSMIII